MILAEFAYRAKKGETVIPLTPVSLKFLCVFGVFCLLALYSACSPEVM